MDPVPCVVGQAADEERSGSAPRPAPFTSQPPPRGAPLLRLLALRRWGSQYRCRPSIFRGRVLLPDATSSTKRTTDPVIVSVESRSCARAAASLASSSLAAT